MERFALIVDDDDRGADLVRLMLEAEGFTVLLAGSADAAMMLMEGQALSVITMALHLPDMDGLQLLTHIRQTPALSKVPVVVLANGAQARAAIDGGAAVLLQKPISRAQLKASLAMLGLHSAREHSYSVLLVDDDPRALEVIASSLPSPAYSLLRALGGREAIDLAHRQADHPARPGTAFQVSGQDHPHHRKGRVQPGRLHLRSPARADATLGTAWPTSSSSKTTPPT
ncbi:MAG: response regulator [Gammaproteobacteria bacterium]|nr:response regulator [Gammaproteobacteria bacterium]